MREMDRQYLETPFYGSRRMKAWLERLMRTMGLRAIYRKPGASRPTPGAKVYPYLPWKARITRPNQVWAADITYLPMARGFLYLVAVMDWHSRYVVGWRLSTTLEAGFCAEALTEALGRGRPEVFNTDQSLPQRWLGAASSPAGSSSRSFRTMRSRSAWTGKDATPTTSSRSGYGGR